MTKSTKKTHPKSIRMPEPLHRKILTISKKENRSYSNTIINILNKYIDYYDNSSRP